MQQEDDLRALAKIMEFGRAVSIFLLVVHVYVYCYPSIASWNLNLEVTDKIIMNFNNNRNLQLRPMEQAGSYPADGRLVSGNKRCQGREDHPAQNPCSTLRRMHPFLSQLVDIGFDPAPCGCHRTLCIHIGVRLSLPADGRIVDEPSIQAQPDGGRVQSRKRVFPTGNTVDGK